MIIVALHTDLRGRGKGSLCCELSYVKNKDIRWQNPIPLSFSTGIPDGKKFLLPQPLCTDLLTIRKLRNFRQEAGQTVRLRTGYRMK